MNAARASRSLLRLLALLLAGVLLVPLAGAEGREYAADKKIGVEERLGATADLDATFTASDGTTVRFGDLLKRPTILMPVYFRCPSICTPLLHEVAATLEKLDLVPGLDFDLIALSFDVSEKPDTAATAKKALLDRMQRKIPPESWHFLTGDAENIMRLTDSVGFHFRHDRGEFLHAATVIFLSPQGKIVRYLGGLKLLPLDLKMAVLDAAEGKPRTLMQRIQQLCYAYDPEGKGYVLLVNRIVLFVTLALLGAFLVYLLVRRRKRAPAPPPAAPGRTAERPV